MRAIVQEFTLARVPPAHPHADAGAGANASTNGWAARAREGVLPFGQLQIELHIWNQRFQDFLEWWELLEAAGLRPFHQEVRARVAGGCSVE